MSRHRRRAVTVVCLAALSAAPVAVSGPPGAAAPDPRPEISAARSATSVFHRVDAATQAGYARPLSGPLHECISADDGPERAMGLHWINGDLVDDATLDVRRPEVLVYQPTKNGRLRLVALEYVVFADTWNAEHPAGVPRLLGRPLRYVGVPNRYELPAFYEIHAWVWKHNPRGMFADHSPRVSCRFAANVDR